jgi:hypothetical protein
VRSGRHAEDVGVRRLAVLASIALLAPSCGGSKHHVHKAAEVEHALREARLDPHSLRESITLADGSSPQPALGFSEPIVAVYGSLQASFAAGDSLVQVYESVPAADASAASSGAFRVDNVVVLHPAPRVRAALKQLD